MTTYYVGPGGNNSLDGTTWDKRKETLNGAEDIPVVAGDTVYVGPGVYRETLTCDVFGSSGNPITYIADVTGFHTDGIGGAVRITGSDNDVSVTRSYGIDAENGSYRTFRGFTIDHAGTAAIYFATTLRTGIVIEDCVITRCNQGIRVTGGIGSDLIFIVRRCMFLFCSGANIYLSTSVTWDSQSVVENCIAIGHNIFFWPQGDNPILVRNCTLYGFEYCFYSANPDWGAQVYNCLLHPSDDAFFGQGYNGQNDYNSGSGNINGLGSNGYVSGSNNTGGDSLGFKPFFAPGLQHPYVYPLELGEFSPFKAIAGSNEATDDFFGKTRPTASAKKSRGAIQYPQVIRSTDNPYGSESVHTRLVDAGYRQIFLPVEGGVEVSIDVRVYRAADYSGTLPQMVIRELDQSPRVTTDTGPSGQYNLLSDTFTPQANVRYVTIDLISDNTATSGDFYVDFGGFKAY